MLTVTERGVSSISFVKQLFSRLEDKLKRNVLSRSGSKIDLCGSFTILIGSYTLALRLKVSFSVSKSLHMLSHVCGKLVNGGPETFLFQLHVSIF